MAAARQQHKVIMRSFPLPDQQMDRFPLIDHTALQQPLVNLEAWARTNRIAKQFSEQLEKLRSHISACYKTWQIVKQRRLESVAMVPSTYKHHHLKLAGPCPTSPRKILDRTNSNYETEDVKGDLLMLSQIRTLALIWRDGLTAAQVPFLSLNDKVLRQLKVACGAECGEKKYKQLFT